MVWSSWGTLKGCSSCFRSPEARLKLQFQVFLRIWACIGHFTTNNTTKNTMGAACSPRNQKNKSEENLPIAARCHTTQHDGVTWRPS
ncbi:hypothetical protein QL285_015031 [Trifolium repens]|nr:hypothetical protein QL285_015031 [Trifolium repens]